jgi:Domain of unknown function (DUF5753)/Helix-turn-helix domain
MSGKSDPVSHFGRQVKKERLARGWGLVELSRRTEIDAGHLSRIENGRRPPTEAVAKACDRVFPERKGYFIEYYEESKSWVPVFFRDWPEIENMATVLRVWMTGVVHGLLQTEGYARALLSTAAGVTDETIERRLKSRMERQRRVLLREPDPPLAFFVVDEIALYREVGGAEAMADQMRHLTAVAARPNVTLQVLPAVAHPATASGFVLADDSAWCEHVVSGGVYDADYVSTLTRMFDSLRAESYRASESAAIIERLGKTWASGVSPLTVLRTGLTA